MFTATYRVYVGDGGGNEILNPGGSSAASTEVWTWQGPATVILPELMVLNRIAIEWPDDFSRYILECAETSDAAVWTRVNTAPVLVDGKSLVLVDPSSAQCYFRLRLAK